MLRVSVLSADRYGYDFVPPEFLPPGTDEYYLRNRQVGADKRAWRRLSAAEIEILVKNDNTCADWDDFRVTDPFDPSLVKNSSFFGLVRIGKLENVVLLHHDLRVHAGIRNSTVISCDIGDNCAIQDCAYLSHYILGDTVILSRIAEMQTTNHAKFGNGVVKDGEDEEVRVRIDVMNEAGGRAILPFDRMICADAFLWAAYRDDVALTDALERITQDTYGTARGAYGTVGSGTVIKNCGILKDAAVGEGAYVKGANKLKNISILSSSEEPTQIGEGVELVNGIVGYGCRVFYGCKAVRFVMGRNSSLKYGARLIHSVLGDNSTVSCCEMLNNLVFPAHEQHHNNSFLIAALIQGQSNMAAGATIGSNHNSRANDGEIRAGRGFWPGLCVTLKHSSRFASFVLISKGDYFAELDIPLPFSLVNNDQARDRLEVMPAYFWMYNLYALERNAWKIEARDKRVVKEQKIEYAYLAPDTAEEILSAMALLETWVARAKIAAEGGASANLSAEDLRKRGRALLSATEDPLEGLTVTGDGMERGGRPTVILKPYCAYRAYRQMLRWYAVRGLMDFAERWPAELAGARVTEWVNLGGQVVPAPKVDALRADIGSGKLRDWDSIHAAYERFAAEYPLDRARHCRAVLELLRTGEGAPLDAAAFADELEDAIELGREIAIRIRESREKDYADPYRRMTYRNEQEMTAVLGSIADNSFVRRAEAESAAFEERAKELAAKLRSGRLFERA